MIVFSLMIRFVATDSGLGLLETI